MWVVSNYFIKEKLFYMDHPIKKNIFSGHCHNNCSLKFCKDNVIPLTLFHTNIQLSPLVPYCNILSSSIAFPQGQVNKTKNEATLSSPPSPPSTKSYPSPCIKLQLLLCLVYSVVPYWCSGCSNSE